MATLSKNLKQHMSDSDVSKAALARASGVSERTVTNFLHPEYRPSKRGTGRSFPSGTLANLFKLASALGIEPWELLHEHGADRFHAAIERAYAKRIVDEQLDDLLTRLQKPPEA